jgi:hypothetical protein
VDDLIAELAAVLHGEHGIPVDVEDRSMLLVQPVKGDSGSAVLRVLGIAQAASPVGAAARGPTGVAAGVWRDPELFLARWTGGRRWVVSYRLAGGSRLNDYVRTEGRVPTRLETGSWYGAVPDEVQEAFFEAGLLLDDPPFPVAPPPARPGPVPPRSEGRSGPAPSGGRPPRPAPGPGPPAGLAAPAPRRREPRPAPPPRREPVATTRLCPACRMHKAQSQFVAGSDFCVDCR